MKIKKYSFTILIASILVGYLIIVNVSDKESTIKTMNANEYKNMQDERNALRKQISQLSEENIELKEKIASYDRSEADDKKSEILVNDMKLLLKEYGMITGINEVKGPGIVVRINDGAANENDTAIDRKNKILHDQDIENVLNYLKYSGAEAIALNNHRIIPNTGIRCYWAFIMFQDGSEEYPTFNFYVIGDPDMLEIQALDDSGYIKKLMYRGLEVSVEKKEEIVLKAYESQSFSFAKQYEGK